MTGGQNFTQEAELSPRNPRDALCLLKYWPTVVWIMQTDHASLRKTFRNFHVLFRYLHSFVHTLGTTIAHQACNAVRVANRLPYNHSCWCQVVNWTTTEINQRRLPPMLLTTPSITPPAQSWMQTTMADGHKGFKQQKWPSRSLKVTRNCAIW